MAMHLLITGVAGFIGAKTAEVLLCAGHRVTGIDNLNNYYSRQLKIDRLTKLKYHPEFTFLKSSIEEPKTLYRIFSENHFDIVIHLAAQAGVRNSIDNPRDYVDSNLLGTFELLEAAKSFPPRHLLLASTSSAYGVSNNDLFIETQKADYQTSFYAATKKATESMAHSYSHLFSIPVTIFRFFTVYGPWGRPDMAPMKFTKKILNGSPINIYNHGKMCRDFTYIDDLAKALTLLLKCIPSNKSISKEIDSLSPAAPYRIVNIGNNSSIELMHFIETLEECLNKKAIKKFIKIQPGEIETTLASTKLLQLLTGFKPKTGLKTGIAKFVEWYLYYNKININ